MSIVNCRLKKYFAQPVHVKLNKVVILSIVSVINSRSEDNHIGIMNNLLYNRPEQYIVRLFQCPQRMKADMFIRFVSHCCSSCVALCTG